MGVDYELYVEAKINGEWHSIDFYQRSPTEEKFDIIPVISGRSAVGSALRWEGLGAKIDRVNLSPELQNRFPERSSWEFFDFWEELGKRDFERPESCGYYPNDMVARFESGEDEEILSIADADGVSYSVTDFAKLTPEAQRGFRYYEWTEQFGYHDIFRRIKRGVIARINAYEKDLRCGALWPNIPEMDGPVRVIINMS